MLKFPKVFKAAAGLLCPPLFFAWSVSADELSIADKEFDSRVPPQLVVSASGHAITAYRNQSGQLIARRSDKKPLLLADANQRALAGVALASIDDQVYAAWQERDSSGTVTLRLRASANQGEYWDKIRTVDDTTQSMPRIAVTGADNDVYVAWLASAATQAKQSDDQQAQTDYHIYARHSPDSGQSWHPTRQLTQGYHDSLWPKLVMRGDTAYAFSASRRDDQSYLLVSHSTADGNWSDAKEIRAISGALLLEPHVVGERLLVMWFGSAGNRFVLRGVVSDDGENWQDFELKDAERFDIGTFAVASQGDSVFLAFSARSVVKPAGPWKRSVYFSRSLDGGLHWEPIRSLRHYDFDHTHAYFPYIAIGEDRTLVVAWNDYRNLRGDLYYNLSRDDGEHWLEQDRLLVAAGKTDDFLLPYISAFGTSGKDYYLLAGRYRDDGHQQQHLLLHRFQTEQPTFSEIVGDEDSLRQQATAFWQALVDGKYAKVYRLYDPFFHQRLLESQYLSMAGNVIHHSFQIGDIHVMGNIAKVEVEFQYEIPPLSLRLGGSYSRPQTEARIEETWLFIDGQWHKEYYNTMGEFYYGRY